VNHEEGFEVVTTERRESMTGDWEPLDETNEIRIERRSNRLKNNAKEYAVWVRKKGEQGQGARVVGQSGEHLVFPSEEAAREATRDFLSRDH
jgi:hypothetical protein